MTRARTRRYAHERPSSPALQGTRSDARPTQAATRAMAVEAPPSRGSCGTASSRPEAAAVLRGVPPPWSPPQARGDARGVLGKDGGHTGGLLPYAASNITSLPSTVAKLTPGALTIISDSCVYSTDNVTPTCNGSTQTPNEPYTITLQGGGQAVVYVFNSLTIGAGSSLWVEGSLPVIFLVTGSVDIHGAIDVQRRPLPRRRLHGDPGAAPERSGGRRLHLSGSLVEAGASAEAAATAGPVREQGTSPGQKYGTAEAHPAHGRVGWRRRHRHGPDDRDGGRAGRGGNPNLGRRPDRRGVGRQHQRQRVGGRL